MKIGKVPPELLKKTVYPFLGVSRKEVLVHSGLGQDCTVIDFGDYVVVASSDPITGAGKNEGYISVFVCCNDIAACGAEPIGILSTLLLPPCADEKTLQDLMESIHRAASKIGIEVLGGHSEITDAVGKPIISSTAIGVAKKQSYITSAGAKPGDKVLVTKALGLEGTSVLASDFEDILKGSISSKQLEKARGLIEHISVITEGLTAAEAGASAMHDITEGGLLGAAFEVAEASGVGIEIYAKNLPILPETRAICDFFGIDPLGLISSGSMLICTPSGEKVLGALEKKGIPATIVGKIIPGKEKTIIFDKKRRPLLPPERDELYRAIENAKKIRAGAV